MPTIHRYWNYRVVTRTHQKGANKGKTYKTVSKVWYSDAEFKNITKIEREILLPVADTDALLKARLAAYVAAYTYPAISAKTTSKYTTKHTTKPGTRQTEINMICAEIRRLQTRG